MALDISSDLLKTRMKNTILKKGFQGKTASPEEIARFKWLNLDGSQKIHTPSDLFEFAKTRRYTYLIPSDDGLFPDLTSALTGQIVFFSEYPKIAKEYEGFLIDFNKQYIQTGQLFEYPIIQSTNVLIHQSELQKFYGLKIQTTEKDEHEDKFIDLLSKNGQSTKKFIKNSFRDDPYVFQRVDYYLYKLASDLKIYKVGFDQIEGNIYDFVSNVYPDIDSWAATPVSLEEILESMIASSLYMNPIKLQRALKKHFSKDRVSAALTHLTQSGLVKRIKMGKEAVLVHLKTMNNMQ